MNILAPRGGSYFQQNIFFFLLLCCFSIILIGFSFSATVVILQTMSDTFKTNPFFLYSAAGLWEVTKSVSAKMLFSGFYRKKVYLDLIAVIFFSVFWAGAVFAGFTAAGHMTASAIIAETQTTTAPPPAPAPGSDGSQGSQTKPLKITANSTKQEVYLAHKQEKTQTAQAEAAKAQAQARALELSLLQKKITADSTAAAEKKAHLQATGEKGAYTFLIVDILCLLCIFGCVHILKHQDNDDDEQEADNQEEPSEAPEAISDAALLQRYRTARANGYTEKMAEHEKEIIKRGLKVPAVMKVVKNTPPPGPRTT